MDGLRMLLCLTCMLYDLIDPTFVKKRTTSQIDAANDMLVPPCSVKCYDENEHTITGEQP